MRFESKKDSWVVYFLVGTTAIVLSMVYLIPSEKEIPLTVHIILAASFGLIYWMYVNTFTLVENNFLLHKCGPIKWKVPVDKIKKIKRKSTSMINHGTWSSDKIDIIYQRGSSLSIAPADKEALIEYLVSLNGEIEVV